MSDAGLVVTFTSGMPRVTPTTDLPVPQPATYEGLAAMLAETNDALATAQAALTAAGASVTALTKRVGTLENGATTTGTSLTAAANATSALTQRVTALETSIAAANAAAVLLTQRVAALEGKPDPCVALSGSLAVATLQIGSLDVQVPVPGLLSSDRIAVEIMADIPSGLTLGAIRPSPTTNGVLLVHTTATLSLSGKAALPLAITALR